MGGERPAFLIGQPAAHDDQKPGSAHTVVVKCKLRSPRMRRSPSGRGARRRLHWRNTNSFTARRIRRPKKIALVGRTGGTDRGLLSAPGWHSVAKFERLQEEAGGCLMYAIPNFRLPKTYVCVHPGLWSKWAYSLSAMQSWGENVKISDLTAEYDSRMMPSAPGITRSLARTWSMSINGVNSAERNNAGSKAERPWMWRYHAAPGAVAVTCAAWNSAEEMASAE